MKVLAIIITYNGKHWMPECLGSLNNSTIPLDVLVIDNLSTDGTPEYIEKHFPQFELIQSNVNLGFGKANNIGLKRVLEKSYDFALLLNQDAWIDDDTVSVLAKLQTHYTQFGILSPVHLNKKRVRLDNKFSHYICRSENNELISDLLLSKRELADIYELGFINAAAWLVSRKCIQKVGGFDPLFPHYGEDNDFIIRARYHGFKAGFSPRTFIVHDREGYTKQPDMKESYEKQYIDRLKLLKDITIPYKSVYFLVVKEEMYFALSFLLKLNFRMFKVKLKILKKIISQRRAIAKSRAYCMTQPTAYLT
ncbi:GT2 family glycosyltransferase [Catalinimonas alkaloidigena]|uniref:glycosyltransferase family 2 protein n=1 Tax=Catalinimonas alkaloidigena TaxID=1075417 RepID=UPI002404A3B9|nr:glycosyltransferase family 2 protein [Catalinimonas alkaloidigena]MDF9801093.1 GT2 family glycosyltransferase [Catalinimonas alkaloidigena]